MFQIVLKELKKHAPFTIFGAASGILVMILFAKIPAKLSNNIFYVFHPIHVLLSALATASMYRLHTCKKVNSQCLKGKCNFKYLLLIGYIGSVGIATLSDSLIPYLGEVMLNMPNRHIHLGFIEKWWLVNPLAILGVFIACHWPDTKFSHTGHVLLSTWASLFHIIMAAGGLLNWYFYVFIFVFLFIAVWLPCCVSDIVVPLLFIKRAKVEI